jgi:hypothetical protein
MEISLSINKHTQVRLLQAMIICCSWNTTINKAVEMVLRLKYEWIEDRCRIAC